MARRSAWTLGMLAATAAASAACVGSTSDPRPVRDGTSEADVVPRVPNMAGPTLRTRNTTFHWHYDHDLLLIEQQHETEFEPGVEGNRGRMRVRAFPVDSETLTPAATPRYAFETEGDQLTVGYTFLEVTRWGCCDTKNTKTYWNVRTGEPIYSTTGHEVRLPNRQLLAVHAEDGITNPVGFEGGRSPCLVIYVGDDRPAAKPFDRLVLHADREPLDYLDDTCRVESVTLEGYNAVRIHMSSPTDGTIRIPLTANNQLDTARAEMPWANRSDGESSDNPTSPAYRF
jgi:hypothetical protein